MEQTANDSIIAQIRKEFYSMRNGIVAETLRKGGLEQKYIFGLQLPQIKSIAERYRPESDQEGADIARTLWRDRNCREARLLACHLMPSACISREEAEQWAADTTTREEADILAFRLLRYLPFSADIADTLQTDGSALATYTAEAIRRFI
ncbi:MAG: DNA alkylation repair protein [Muribaculaceae bacterium]|nr:DNA alkylation repair protein [Muribaculaceae bacterium]